VHKVVTALPDIDALSLRLRGYRLPGGYFTVEQHQAEAVARLVRAPHPAHPILSSVGSLKSLGVSIGALCALCEFELADGPLLGEFSVRFLSQLQPGLRYGISATIDSIERTHSRTLGVLDRLHFTVRFDDPSNARVAEARYLWLLPRGILEQR
jgi:hypothetical protein